MLPHCSLELLPVGCFGRVLKIIGAGINVRRLMDLGLIPGTIVESIRRSPSGDPTAYGIRGAVIALRAEESHLVLVEPQPQ
ncbi:MAG TPA: ferrous iron transport protein A [Firmicutes bacterium]|nr:ferrous iron transport protein A [Bacillota bacterium]HAZ22189.1 ferrous iron transport protein A [Bacillota bacterium]HBE06812.1 ferrous iron transport protein A [Bacillota bacterium]HBG44606.1 ferrous iron transport protein A [Bacillota bacterium]HBL49045.1 ferrous iron transport protein A [Bacillota bacterium]